MNQPQNNQQQPQQFRRTTPQSDLDYNMLITDPTWGTAELSPELKKVLARSYQVEAKDKDGNVSQVSLQSVAWDMLNYYKRDLRLANLNAGKNPLIMNEQFYCEYYLDLAGDFLEVKMYRPFIICLRRVATKLELSQSRNGFLRRQLQTFRQEHITQDLNPPKKGLFGFGGKKQ